MSLEVAGSIIYSSSRGEFKTKQKVPEHVVSQTKQSAEADWALGFVRVTYCDKLFCLGCPDIDWDCLP